MASPQPAVRRSRGRPRTPGAEARILEAALEEYGERGWGGFTMDAVARRAAVGKSTVYLRWRDKNSLLTDAVCSHSSGVEDVDTGSLAGDLEAVATNLFLLYLEPRGWATFRVTVDAAASSSPLAAVGEKLALQRALAVDTIIRRAVARGEAPADTPVMTVVQCLYGAVAMEVLMLSGDDRRLDAAEVETRAGRLSRFLVPAAG